MATYRIYWNMIVSTDNEFAHSASYECLYRNDYITSYHIEQEAQISNTKKWLYFDGNYSLVNHFRLIASYFLRNTYLT